MGKRKREEMKDDDSIQHKRLKMEPSDEEDEAGNNSDSSRSSVYLPEELYNETVDNPHYNSRPKKRDTIPTSDDLPNGSTNGSPRKDKKKKSKHSSEMNGFGDVEVDSSEHSFYFIRKPVDISIEQLKIMKLSKLSSGDKKVKLKTENGTYILKPEQTPKPLVYFPSTVVMTAKDAQKIKSSGFISLQAVLVPEVKEIPGGPIYNGEEIPDNLEMVYPISSIRKQPKVDWETKQERLKAFGVKQEKKRKSKTPKSEPMSAGSSSPSEPIAGGQDMSEGIMSIVRPAIQQLDNQVSSTRQSQVILASKIQELADIMHDMCEDQPYDLNQYSRKLADSKRRVQSTGKLLEKVHDRLSNLQRDIAREAHAKKNVVTGIAPAAPLR